MKKLLATLAVLVIATSLVYAQDTKHTSYTKEGKTFVQKDQNAVPFKGDQVTEYIWKDAQGNEYPIILHTYTKGDKKGRTTAYVIRKSQKTGKEYKQFIPDGEQIASEILNDNK